MWIILDDKKSFVSVLVYEGFFLSWGDKKNVYVVVDWYGEVYVIICVIGEKFKLVKVKLGELDLLFIVDVIKVKIIKE